MPELIFHRPPAGGSPSELAFGNEEGAAPSQDAVARAFVHLPGPRAAIRMAPRKTVQVGIALAGARVALHAAYQSRAERPGVGETLSGFGEADAGRASRPVFFQQAGISARVAPVRGRAAILAAGAVLHAYQEAGRVSGSRQQGMQDAARRAWGVVQAWQEAVRRRFAVQQGSRIALPRSSAVLHPYQEATHLSRWLLQGFGVGNGAGAGVASAMRKALLTGTPFRGRYQQASHPGPGIAEGRPVDPPDPAPCYMPARGGQVELVFSRPKVDGSELVFICCKPGTKPQPPRYVIPQLKVYMTVHTMEAALLPGMEAVTLSDVTIASDDDGFGWSFSANGPEHLLDQLAPSGGLPARLRVVVDGIDFVFVVQSLSRTRSFGSHRVAVQGVSATALLSSPYMPEQTWLNSAPATAQQLIRNALEFTGVQLDWKVSDWLVPEGAWSHRGTPLSAVMRVAASIGAVVSSHRTQERLIVAPRFAHLPWNWADATPDVRMPADVIVTDDLRPEPRAAYNAIYVSGQAGGILGHVRRAGTAGNSLAPQVTDALITEAVAARQRGEAVLGASGNKLVQSITMPLLSGGTAPGLIRPGQLIEVVDTGESWRGLVRATRLSAALPAVRQQITVERAAL